MAAERIVTVQTFQSLCNMASSVFGWVLASGASLAHHIGGALGS